MRKEYLSTLLMVPLFGGLFLWVWYDRQRHAPPPLEQAAASGDTAKVERLLKSGVDVNAHPTHRPPAIVAATQNGKTDAVRLLLQKGADRESRDAALAVAVRKCDLPSIQLLLAGGADGKSLLKPDASGKSPYAGAKEQVGVGPSPCADVIRALELSGITDKPLSQRHR